MALDDRFSMTTERYLGKHHVLVYMEDAVAQLLEHREENSKINPIKFLCEYFNSVRDGNHTMFREFSYIHATPHNRASFVRLFWKCYRQIGKKGDLLSIQEYHSLLSLLCSDFPFEPVQKTAKIILLDDALDCLISFSDFIYAFQVQFYFEEFIEKSHEVYLSLHQTQRSPRDPVVVPSGSDDTKVHQNSHHPGDGVDATQYFRAIYPLCDRSNFRTPPVNVLKEILFNVPRVSFYGFLMSIAKSEKINEHIGRLPSKAELLEGADADLTVPTVRLSNSSTTSVTKSKARPISATTPQDAPQNVYSTQRPPSASQRKTPPSRSGAVNNSMKVKRGTTKKDSTDESSSDDSDDSTDTN
ncbi:centriolar satellite-associated tubulin polyglutamylase complex regulator 1-like isoform X2 [Ostrea edulis]|uniref:centriolar satellite-associated tubulin polyglutamylase complex regulator 1-like isoform X2 n=1 Tax=Ostrea edulis TaxID=37623 RepID=UPI002094AF53|nr:centriolar satellite-associated tubulin polyglutamylase complex regulator 1-like isoform X2 [Ostrea edulis]